LSAFSSTPIAATESAETSAQSLARWRTIRAWAWGLYGVVAAIYLLTIFSPLAGLTRILVTELIYTTPIVITVALSLVAARRSEGAERLFWLFLGAANAILAMCEVLLVVWLLFISPLGPPRVEWPFQVMHVTAAACFVGLMVSMSRLQESGVIVRVRNTIDIVLVGAMAYVVLLVAYARPVMPGAPMSAVLVGAGYALAAFMLMAGTLGNIVGFKLVKWRAWERMTLLALGVYALAVSLWPLWYMSVGPNNRNLSRGMLDLVQLSGHYVLMMAAIYRLTELADWRLRPLPTPAIMRNRWAGLLIPACAMAAIPILGWAAFETRFASHWSGVYAVLAMILTALVLIRSLLTAFEHGALFHRSVTDPLTGLFNHRYFHDRLASEAHAAVRYGEELAVAVIDIDDFGAFNDVHGHLGGDRLLASIGARLRDECPEPITVARLGGDEFGLLVPGVSVQGATVLTQHVLDVIGIELGLEPGSLSASAGVAGYPAHSDGPLEILALADGALFHAKETGKDRVVTYDAARVPDLSAHERIDRLELNSRISAVRALAAAVDAHDTATRFHSQKVAALTLRLAGVLGFDEEQCRQLELAALMHDVGKIALSETILSKPGPLDDAEWAEVRQHPVRGERILGATELVEMLPWVRGHHERWDGTGYPDGLAGREIPLEARILGVCDALEAMTSDRAYRPAMPLRRALDKLTQAAGTQFDPHLVEELVCLLARDEARSEGEVDVAGHTVRPGMQATLYRDEPTLSPGTEHA
jgi:diguanylate cyclase (GGDEF)-like protein